MTHLNPRPLGDTGLLTSPLGLGLAALGRPGYINLGHADDLEDRYEVSAMEARAHRVLDAAFEGGITYFDAARSYGRAEAFLSSWLKARNISRSTVVVGSKWGYRYTADWQVEAEHHEIKEHSLGMLQVQWQETQSLLGDYLDLYQIHSATLESGVLENSAVLNELASLKEAGVAIGLTTSGPRQPAVIERATRLQVDGVRLFDTVQSTWNLLETAAGPALAEAHTAGLGIIIKEGVANGRLTSKNPDAAFLAPLQKEADRLDTTIDALALAAVLAQTWADLVLSGAASEAQVVSNIHALGVAFDTEAWNNLQVLATPPDEYWATRGRLAWN